MSVTCDQVLTDPDGLTAQCMVTRGIEHSHHDMSARESVAAGNQLLDGRGLLFDPDGYVVGCPDCWYQHEPSPDRLACSNCDRVFAR